MQRQISNNEIQKAHETYVLMSKPYIERLNQIHSLLTPKIVIENEEAKIIYEETDEIIFLRGKLGELQMQIKSDLGEGRFL